MGKMVVKGSKYTDEQRTEAAIQYAITGSLRKVSELVSIPEETIGHWKRNCEWWDAQVALVQGEKAQEHRATYARLVEEAQNKALELIPNMTSAKDALMIAAISTDKIRTHDGMPTSYTAKAGDIESLANTFKELSRRMETESARVVSVQDGGGEQTSLGE